MTAKRTFGLLLLFVFSMSLLAASAEAPPNAQRPPQKSQPAAQERVIIPKEIKAVLQEGLISRQGRQDIPFEITENLMLPAQKDLYPVFFFKVRNGDLGFAPSADATMPGFEARLNVFLQFLQEDASGVPQINREVFVPFAVQVPSEGYDPDAVEWYSVGLAMYPGNYTLAMALTSTDLQKVGVEYFDFVLPDPASFQQSIETTPIFLIKELNQTSAAEQRPVIHKGMFTYAILQITPLLDRIIVPGDTVELLFYVFGAKAAEMEDPQQRPQFDIDVEYLVNKDDDSLEENQKLRIRWPVQKYQSPLVSQPLPFPPKQTVIVKDEKGEEKQEDRDFEAGKYILHVKIKDNISGLTIEKTVPFEFK